MAQLAKDSASRTLIRMAVALLAGTFALNVHNLTDTWFVSRRGTGALAAMSFTFPIVMLLGFLMRASEWGP
jgi:Na+-driven multidrug efflux pump